MADHGGAESELGMNLSQLGGVLLSEQSLDDLLQLVVALALRSVPTADGVSISLVRDQVVVTPHYSDDVVRELDAVQYQTGQGPCLEAIRENRVVTLTLAGGQGRYPRFADAALQRFVTAVLSTPLSVRDQPLGALNFYSASLPDFGAAEAETASLFAQGAAILLANAIAYDRSSATNAQLMDALATRDVIGQAKGILIARTQCTSDEAFDQLRERSQRTNRKLRDLAAEMVRAAQQRPGSDPAADGPSGG